jgi:lysophospholipase L1-like esterase
MEQRLIAIGDSITLGHWDPDGGWIARLRRESDRIVVETDRRQYAAVYNLGISSNLSSDVLARWAEVPARLLQDDKEQAFIALAVGINDSQLANGEEKVSLGEYAENMSQLVEKALALRASKTIVIGPTPVYEPLTTPVSWGKIKKSFTNERVATYSQTAATVASDAGVPFIDLFNDPKLQGPAVHLAWDGLHLNQDGHHRIAERVGAALVDLGWKAWPPASR